tara:strand:- start:739 stop:1050 length:312 start_codon:yes stop_codon:yes gene_type:complete
MWKKLKSMRIPGDIWAPALVGAMLGITGVLFITLPISRTNDSTLGESIFGKNESLEILLKINEGQELRLKVTGASTMEVVQSLSKMLKSLDVVPLAEQSSPFI